MPSVTFQLEGEDDWHRVSQQSELLGSVHSGSSTVRRDNQKKFSKDGWRRQGQAFRKRLVKQDDEGNHFVLSNDCAIERYYHIADSVMDKFLNHPVDKREELIEAYLIGMRLSKFLSVVLPKHKDYFDPFLQDLQRNSQQQLQELLVYLEQMELLIDQEEYQTFISKVIDTSMSTKTSFNNISFSSSESVPFESRSDPSNIEAIMSSPRYSPPSKRQIVTQTDNLPRIFDKEDIGRHDEHPLSPIVKRETSRQVKLKPPRNSQFHPRTVPFSAYTPSLNEWGNDDVFSIASSRPDSSKSSVLSSRNMELSVTSNQFVAAKSEPIRPPSALLTDKKQTLVKTPTPKNAEPLGDFKMTAKRPGETTVSLHPFDEEDSPFGTVGDNPRSSQLSSYPYKFETKIERRLEYFPMLSDRSGFKTTTDEFSPSSIVDFPEWVRAEDNFTPERFSKGYLELSPKVEGRQLDDEENSMISMTPRQRALEPFKNCVRCLIE